MAVRIGLIGAIAALALAGCAAAEFRSYIGQPIESAMLDQGRPENVFDLPDGRRAFQFRWGGGSAMLPGQTFTTATAVGNTVMAQTTGTPGGVVSSLGCLVTLIARSDGAGRWIVDEYREPKQLVC